MTFRIGQKVVCVNDSPDPRGRPINVVKGGVYTIAAIVDWFGQMGVLLVEADPGKAPGWKANRFRPLVERKTDIGIFTRMVREKVVEVAS